MLPVIENLLILQDRDRKILTLLDELAHIGPERDSLRSSLSSNQAALDAAKQKVMHLESDRKKLELDVEAKKQQIEKYSIQQFQTKKNEEFKALEHEIANCKETILKLDDQQIELMEQIEAAQKTVAAANKNLADSKKVVESRIADIGAREGNLNKELAELQSNRDELAAVVDESTRSKYDRLLKQKGQNVLVGIQHGVCGGCHMQLSRSIMIACQGDQEIVTCPNCNRILFYTRDMDLAVAD
jgi:predicted  nucleic acid-binding Zn-ribbon protein